MLVDAPNPPSDDPAKRWQQFFLCVRLSSSKHQKRPPRLPIKSSVPRRKFARNQQRKDSFSKRSQDRGKKIDSKRKGHPKGGSESPPATEAAYATEQYGRAPNGSGSKDPEHPAMKGVESTVQATVAERFVEQTEQEFDQACRAEWAKTAGEAPYGALGMGRGPQPAYDKINLCGVEKARPAAKVPPRKSSGDDAEPAGEDDVELDQPKLADDACRLAGEGHGKQEAERIERRLRVQLKAEQTAAQKDSFVKKQRVKYHDKPSNNWIDAIVVAVELDDDLVPYYTINYGENKEKGTVRKMLKRVVWNSEASWAILKKDN